MLSERAHKALLDIYRHDYDGVQERLILTTVRQSLPALAEAIEAEIARAGSA